MEATKVGWRVSEFCADTGLKKSKVYEMIAAGELKAVKVGRATVIRTPPAEMLDRHSDNGVAAHV